MRPWRAGGHPLLLCSTVSVRACACVRVRACASMRVRMHVRVGVCNVHARLPRRPPPTCGASAAKATSGATATRTMVYSTGRRAAGSRTRWRLQRAMRWAVQRATLQAVQRATLRAARQVARRAARLRAGSRRACSRSRRLTRRTTRCDPSPPRSPPQRPRCARPSDCVCRRRCPRAAPTRPPTACRAGGAAWSGVAHGSGALARLLASCASCASRGPGRRLWAARPPSGRGFGCLGARTATATAL